MSITVLGWVLPFSEVIDWNKAAIWADERLIFQVPSIGNLQIEGLDKIIRLVDKTPNRMMMIIPFLYLTQSLHHQISLSSYLFPLTAIT